MMKEFAADISTGMRIYIEADATDVTGAGATNLKQTIVGAISVMVADNEDCMT